jgi:hypothetical protein
MPTSRESKEVRAAFQAASTFAIDQLRTGCAVGVERALTGLLSPDARMVALGPAGVCDQPRLVAHRSRQARQVGGFRIVLVRGGAWLRVTRDVEVHFSSLRLCSRDPSHRCALVEDEVHLEVFDFMDLIEEGLLSFGEVAEILPRRRGGRKIHRSCLHRWASAGLRGHRLETVQVGMSRYTSRQALNRFFARLAKVDASVVIPTPESASSTGPATGRILDREGF